MAFLVVCARNTAYSQKKSVCPKRGKPKKTAGHASIRAAPTPSSRPGTPNRELAISSTATSTPRLRV